MAKCDICNKEVEHFDHYDEELRIPIRLYISESGKYIKLVKSVHNICTSCLSPLLRWADDNIPDETFIELGIKAEKEDQYANDIS